MTRQTDFFTIGHSNHPIGRFVELLRHNGVTALADVRTVPHSRWVPHFGKAALERQLREADIAYIFMGDQLGGRPRDKSLWRGQHVDYDLVAATAAFNLGLDDVMSASARGRLALMCAERDPLQCHRFLLVARQLARRGALIEHILADGRRESQAETERRAANLAGGAEPRLPL